MDVNPQNLSSRDCFMQFMKSPKDVSMKVLEGTHKFLAQTIQNGKGGPKIQDLVKVFDHFTQGSIQRYVFNRMTKPILLELALRIVQEISLNGVGRAKNLQLELVKSKSGGQTVRIADPFSDDENPVDEAALKEIDEAYFRLLDSEGLSPEVKFAAGQGHKAPYSPFAKDGGFIRPKPAAARSLDLPIEVINSRFPFLSCGLAFPLALVSFQLNPAIWQWDFNIALIHIPSFRRRLRKRMAISTLPRSR